MVCRTREMLPSGRLQVALHCNCSHLVVPAFAATAMLCVVLLCAGPTVMIARPMPRVLLLHTGGTLGMDAGESFQTDEHGHVHLKHGTGGQYPNHQALKPGKERGQLLVVAAPVQKHCKWAQQ